MYMCVCLCAFNDRIIKTYENWHQCHTLGNIISITLLNLDKTMALKIKVGIFIDYFIADEEFVPFSGG